MVKVKVKVKSKLKVLYTIYSWSDTLAHALRCRFFEVIFLTPFLNKERN